VLAIALGAGCRGPAEVRFDRQTCFIDGKQATVTAVEEREAEVGHRLASRQPWLVAMTIMVVALAGISYVERLAFLFSASRASRTMGDRFKDLVDRYRSHPVRYFSLLGATVGLMVLAATLYIYFDADKRSSERTLATLQFCHLALRTDEEKRALDDQRSNLASIHETAGAIRQLIDKLPPTEQAKAHEIVGHMDDAIKREGRLIADDLHRSDDAVQAIRDGTLSIARDLTGLEGRMAGLEEVPVGLRSVGEAVRKLEARQASGDQALSDVGARLGAVQKSLDALVSRPPPSCPACVCDERPVVSAAAAVAPDASVR
jgi:hypothetical protein